MSKYLLGFGLVVLSMFAYTHYANAQEEQEKKTLEERIMLLEQRADAYDNYFNDISTDIGTLDYRSNVLNKRIYYLETLNHLAKVTK